MACAQTGSGKTGAMLIPMINYLISQQSINPRGGPSQEVKGVIVAPTRELATQEMVVFFLSVDYKGKKRSRPKIKRFTWMLCAWRIIPAY